MELQVGEIKHAAWSKLGNENASHQWSWRLSNLEEYLTFSLEPLRPSRPSTKPHTWSALRKKHCKGRKERTRAHPLFLLGEATYCDSWGFSSLESLEGTYWTPWAVSSEKCTSENIWTISHDSVFTTHLKQTRGVPGRSLVSDQI
jgi:hypothetical protein